jgi:hypothetical protein
VSRAIRVLCPTPEQYCVGADTSLPKMFKGNRKTHGDGKDARNCYKKYLIRVLGYKQGDKANEMIPPDPEQPVLVLTRESRFGGMRLRSGKAGRMMNERGSGHVIG